MKFKVFLLTFFMLFILSCQCVPALPTKLPQTSVQQVSDEEFNDETTNLFFGFFQGVIKILLGENNKITVKSKDVKNLSNTVKIYQEQELANNPEYEESNAKDKADFGTMILDIIAGVLSIFGL